MDKYLIEQIKKMKGVTLGVGIDNEKIKEAIQNNNDIQICYLLEESKSLLNKKKMKIFNNNKTINIKKIRKTFKKKRINNLICNYKTIKPFLKTFVRDSVYINKNSLYIYGTNEEHEEIVKRYKRYTTNIKTEKNKENFLIFVNNENSKNNKIKDIGYWWKDTFSNIADILTQILVN